MFLYATALEKLTIYVEGPTDVAYIQKAATILGQEALLQGVDLEPIGDQTGQKGGGWKAMTQGFNFLRYKPLLRPNKVLFLYDQDVKDGELPKKVDDLKNILVRRIDKYSAEKKGIEWLFAESIFEEAFDKGWIEKDLGRITSHNPTAKYVTSATTPRKILKAFKRFSRSSLTCSP